MKTINTLESVSHTVADANDIANLQAQLDGQAATDVAQAALIADLEARVAALESASGGGGTPPPSGGGNDYFDALAAAGETVLARGYRDQGEIDADTYVSKGTLTYDATADACLSTVDAHSGEDGDGPSLRAAFTRIKTGTLLVTWDQRVNDGWHAVRNGCDTWKHFHLASQVSRAGDGNRRIEVRSRFSQATPPDVAEVDVRGYGLGTPNDDELPQVGVFFTKPDVWARYWAVVDFGAKTFQLWVADANNDAVQLIDVAIPGIDGLDWFWLQQDTSQSRTGPQHDFGHFRNLVVQHNASPVFERPLA